MREQYVNSDEQCINSDFVPCTVNPCEVTIYAQGKKKKTEENVKVKTCRRIHHYPNGHLVCVWILMKN